MNKVLEDKLKSLPRTPGVYIYKNKKGVVIYVGKAKNLKNRVGSYFQSYLDTTSKTHALVSHIDDMEYIEVLTEFDALILEAELIKKYRPRYNIAYKDDKSYLYIIIRNEKVLINGKKVLLPVVKTARLSDLISTDITFGPYPEGNTAKYIVRTVRRIFPFRDCTFTKFGRYNKLNKPCLYGHIGVCSAPCVKFSDADLSQYKKNIINIKKILTGGSVSVVKNLRKEMNSYSKRTDYETAAKFRDLLIKFEYVTKDFKSARDYINNPYLVHDIAKQSLESLVEVLPDLKRLPERIECYDISNVSGTDAVGSMVVATNGEIDKREYRMFKIKGKKTPDDFEMMREVLYRRLKREVLKDKSIKKKWGLPSLLVVDGGKGQVSAAYDVLSELGLNIPLIGLAKKYETIVIKELDTFKEIKLARSHNGLKLLIALRNEAHRFAQAYHHKLRLKKILPKS